MKWLNDWLIALSLLRQYRALGYPFLLCLPSIPISIKLTQLLSLFTKVHVVSGTIFNLETNTLGSRVNYLSPLEAARQVSDIQKSRAALICFTDQGSIKRTQTITVDFMRRQCEFGFIEYLLAAKSGSQFHVLCGYDEHLQFLAHDASVGDSTKITADNIRAYMAGLLGHLATSIQMCRNDLILKGQLLYRQARPRRLLLMAPLLEIEGMARISMRNNELPEYSEAAACINKINVLRAALTEKIKSGSISI
jgi:hypothetical protein